MGVCPLAATIADGVDRESELYLHHKDGHRIPVFVRVSPLKDSADNIIGGIELFCDISNIHANSLRILELETLALLDNLTQLANRHYIERELQVRIEESKRLKISFGVLFIDVDNFKTVNDTHGHDVGDAVLRFVAQTFIANSRPFDLYGRWGGDEFIAIIRNVNSNELVELGERLRILIEHSYIVQDKKKLQVTVSMGATSIRKNDSPASLIKRADTLLYQSKKRGRNCLTNG